MNSNIVNITSTTVGGALNVDLGSYEADIFSEQFTKTNENIEDALYRVEAVLSQAHTKKLDFRIKPVAS